ncbi:MAG: DUF664 domain-containing protein [Marmoricola sp.]
MVNVELKVALHDELRWAREAMLWKLDGLSEYDVRRPLTATGTNFLGLIKHLSMGESKYLGEVFGRPFREHLPWWDDDAEDNEDKWATASESPVQRSSSATSACASTRMPPSTRLILTHLGTCRGSHDRT